MMGARMKRWRNVLACLACLAGSAIASDLPATSEAAATSVSAQRIVTLAPNATEIVYAAGGGDQMAGTVTSSDFPPAAKSLPRIGDGIVLNAERIMVLRPTLIVGWLRSGIAPEVEALAKQLGADMTYTTPARLLDIPADVRRLGTLLGTTGTANDNAAAMEARIDALKSQYAGRRPVSVFIEVGSTPLYTIGNDPLVNDALRICGGVNLYGASRVPAPRVPVEGVLTQDPRLVIVPARDNDDVTLRRKRWASYGLKAAIEGRVLGVDPDALFRPGPRLIDATEALCAAIDAARMDYP